MAQAGDSDCHGCRIESRDQPAGGMEKDRVQRRGGRRCRGGLGRGTRAPRELVSGCQGVSGRHRYNGSSSPILILLDVEDRSTVFLPVLLTVLPLQLPHKLPILLQEPLSHVFDSLFGVCLECCLDIIIVVVVLLDEGVEFLEEVCSEVQLLVQVIEVIDCSWGI